jgi:hypothetical protein
VLSVGKAISWATDVLFEQGGRASLSQDGRMSAVEALAVRRGACSTLWRKRATEVPW